MGDQHVAVTTQDSRIITLRRHNPDTEWVSNPQPFSWAL